MMVLNIQVGRGCWKDVLWSSGKCPYDLPDSNLDPFLLADPVCYDLDIWIQDPSSLLPG